MPAVLLFLLWQLRSAVAAPQRSNPFGIGAYYPPGAGQIATAAELVGKGGWVLILVPCGNVTSETKLPPTCPGFDPAAEMLQAWKLGLNVVVRLEPQYSAWGCSDGSCNATGRGVCFGAQPGQANWVLPDSTQSWTGHLRATHDPGSNHTSYREVAKSYAKVAASLPKPSDGSRLFVQIGNGTALRDSHLAHSVGQSALIGTLANITQIVLGVCRAESRVGL
jgi:hypothetical protein